MRACFSWLVSLCLLVFLTACGGGGGGGGGGAAPASAPPVEASVDKTAITLAYEEGTTVGSTASILLTVKNIPSTGVYIGGEATGTAISSADDINFSVVSDSQASFQVSAKTGLTEGTYTGDILIYVCLDIYCTKNAPGTPLKVKYTLTVTPTLKVSPTSVTINSVSGVAGKATVNVTLPNGYSGFTATQYGGSPQIFISGQTSNTLTLETKPWRSGTYGATVQLTAGSRVVNLPVSYVVSAPPGGENDLLVAPGGLTFSAVEGQTPATKTLAITLPSWGSPSDVSIGTGYYSGSGWLNVVRTQTGANVTVSAAALSKGTYSAYLVFTPSVPGTAVTVPVSFTVGDGLATPAPISIAVTNSTVSAALSGAVPVTSNGVAMGWTATADQPWLKLPAASGTTGGSLSYTVDAAALGAMTNFGSTSAKVTITPALSNVTPVSFTVQLSKSLAEVHFVGPYALVTGRPMLVHVRGKGFNSVSDLAAQFTAGSLPVADLTLVDDGHLTFKTTPSSVATHPVAVANGLGLATSSATLNAVAPVVYGDAVVPSAGKKRTVVLDPLRQALYVTNSGTDALTRHRFDGTNWNTDAVAVPSVVDVGMAPDGQRIMVTSSGALRLLDPTTLSTKFSLAQNFAGGYTTGIFTTNNGWSWLATGTGDWNDLGYFDHRSLTMKPRPSQPELSTMFYSGPWMSASRNGERMIVTQSGSISPAQPLLYLDATTSLLKVNPANLTFGYQVFMSDDGSRVMFDQNEVRDQSFGLVGKVRLPDSTYMAVSGVVAPDGSKVYVLAYPQDWVYGTNMPRLYVLDASVSPGLQEYLPVLGYRTMTAYPTCRSDAYGCNLRPQAAISPDGDTVFFVGDVNLIVASTALPAGTTATTQTKPVAPKQRVRKLAPGLAPGVR
ncbi:hypothetical protein [Viridibacterium curvum]|uniref:BACON domain-containing protein n=1 Tax=Viridibacterium curvum TaxID=1101404 RepID=A0ABP9QX06_9RHOO